MWLKPGMTVLAKASSNLTDWPNDSWSCRLVTGSQLSSWAEASAQSMRLTWGRDLEVEERPPLEAITKQRDCGHYSVWYWSVKCSHESYECPINPDINPKPVYRHSNTWQYYLLWFNHRKNVWCTTEIIKPIIQFSTVRCLHPYHNFKLFSQHLILRHSCHVFFH
jgi:hypothetical protein